MQCTRLGRLIAAGALIGLAATGLVAAPASAATIGLAVDVASDGNGPFTPTDEPGGDTGAQNGIVRTFDALSYRVTVNANDGAAKNERFTARAPSGTTWSGVPGRCSGSGSGIVADELTCNLGDVAEGVVEAVPVVLSIGGDMKAGDAVQITVTATADDTANGPVSETSPVVRVSAAPRYDLSKIAQPVAMTPGVTGPSGQDGIQLRYPVTIIWRPVVEGQGLLGYERTDGTFRFRDDVSGMTGGGRGGPATLFAAEGGPACGLNTAQQFRALPGGRGGGTGSVPDSGRMQCSQSGPGQPVDVTFTGVDTALDPSRIVSTGVSGAPLTGGAKPFVVSAWITVWVPKPPMGVSIVASDIFSPVSSTSVSGQPNYPRQTEPLANNTASRNLSSWQSGTGGKSLERVLADGSTAQGSAKSGDPNVTPSQKLRSEVSMTNPGLDTYRGAIACDVFDRGTQRLSRNSGPRPVYASSTGFTNSRVEYAAFDFTEPGAARDATCDDADGPWFSAPEDVPGGLDAVGMVRAVGDLPGGMSAFLYSFVDVRTAEYGARGYDFGHLWFGAGSSAWWHDVVDPVVGAGPLADSVVIWPVVARIAQKIVDPGSTPEDTPDETNTVTNGDSVRFALYPSLTNATGGAVSQDVTVQAELPAHTVYVDGSASIVPDRVEEFTDGDGHVRHRLVWVLRDRVTNEKIQPLTYDVAVPRLAVSAPVTSTTEIGAPLDGSAVAFRTAERAFRIVNASGIGVEKLAVEPTVIVGDELEWDLEYSNTASMPIPGVDLIDVLPHDGDADSTFHGAVGLAGAVPVDRAAGERALYTATDPTKIDMDPEAPSNQPGGATRWCEASESSGSGCPTNFDAVTAIRIVRTSAVRVGEVVVHRVTLSAPGALGGDRLTNRFGLRTPGLALPVRSNRATISVVSGEIGDRVWDDLDHDGLQDDGEPGVARVGLTLIGTDDRGRDVRRTTTTDDDGVYLFNGLRPGAYVVRFAAPLGDRFTKVRVGGDGEIDSDADADGRTDVVELVAERDDDGTLVGVTDDSTVDAGLIRTDGTVEPDPGASVPTGGSGRGEPGGTGGLHGALAYTGVALPAGGIVLAVVALVAGLVVLVLRRRRSDGDEQHE